VWNTLNAVVLTPSSAAVASVGAQRSNYAGNAAGAARITPLTAVALTTEARTLTGMASSTGCSAAAWCRGRWC